MVRRDVGVYLRGIDCERDPQEEACLAADVVLLGNFEGTTDRWSAGAATTVTNAVNAYANSPGTASFGQGVLEAAPVPGTPGTTWRSVVLELATPLDGAPSRELSLDLNGYGGSTATYQARVRATGIGGAMVERVVAVTPDQWNALTVDLAGLGDQDLHRVEVSFRSSAAGDWPGRFQIDRVLVS